MALEDVYQIEDDQSLENGIHNNLKYFFLAYQGGKFNFPAVSTLFQLFTFNLMLHYQKGVGGYELSFFSKFKPVP